MTPPDVQVPRFSVLAPDLAFFDLIVDGRLYPEMRARIVDGGVLLFEPPQDALPDGSLAARYMLPLDLPARAAPAVLAMWEAIADYGKAAVAVCAAAWQTGEHRPGIMPVRPELRPQPIDFGTDDTGAPLAMAWSRFAENGCTPPGGVVGWLLADHMALVLVAGEA